MHWRFETKYSLSGKRNLLTSIWAKEFRTTESFNWEINRDWRLNIVAHETQQEIGKMTKQKAQENSQMKSLLIYDSLSSN